MRSKTPKNCWVTAALLICALCGALSFRPSLATGQTTRPESGSIAPGRSPTSGPAHPATQRAIYTQKIPESELIADFGLSKSAPIESGFLFLDGRYVDAPYVVARKGLSVEVNGQHVYKVHLPEKEPPSGDTDPDIPASITANTSQHDPVLEGYIEAKIAYVQKHHTPEEERKIMEQVYRSLPFVVSGELVGDGAALRVTYTNGDTSQLMLNVPRRKGKFDRASVLATAERKAVDLAEGLREGQAIFLFSNGSRASLPSGLAAERLPSMVGVLRSADTEEDRVRGLAKASGFSPHTARKLAGQFSASSQLDQRVYLLGAQISPSSPAPSTQPAPATQPASSGGEPAE
jgi:hypothetical protein